MTTGRQANTNREINWVTDEDGNVLGYMKDGKTLIPFTEVPMRLLTATTNAATPYDRGLTYNNASNGTIDCPAGALPEGSVIQQSNTGTITANAGSGVTWIKADDGTTVTTLSTTAKGKQIIITKTAIANTFIVKVA